LGAHLQRGRAEPRRPVPPGGGRMSRRPTDAVAATDRGVWRTISRREFVERIRDRGFQVSTAITLLILVGLILAQGIFGGPKRFDLGLVGTGTGSGGGDLGTQVVAAAKALGIGVDLQTYPTQSAAEAALRSGDADAVIIDDERIVVKSDPPAELTGLVQAVSLRLRSERALE